LHFSSLVFAKRNLTQRRKDAKVNGNWVIVNCYCPTNYQLLNYLTEAEFAAEGGELGLFGGGEDAHGIDDADEVVGPDVVDEGAAVFREMNVYTTAVVLAALAIDKVALDKIVDDEGHVATAFEYLVA
jgi:hypothetical protein